MYLLVSSKYPRWLARPGHTLRAPCFRHADALQDDAWRV